MRLSLHFSVADLTRSDTAQACGIDNSAAPHIVENLRVLACGLEQVQALLGHPLEISSAYRSPELNAAVCGAPASHHVEGWAADFACPGYGSPLEVARALAASPLTFDTVILEFGRWVHLSFAPQARRRALTIHDDGEGYVEGLPDEAGARHA